MLILSYLAVLWLETIFISASMIYKTACLCGLACESLVEVILQNQLINYKNYLVLYFYLVLEMIYWLDFNSSDGWLLIGLTRSWGSSLFNYYNKSVALTLIKSINLMINQPS